MIVLGIDPGQSTGLAVYANGILQALVTVNAETLPDWIAQSSLNGLKPNLIAFEDSRLTSHVFAAKGLSRAASLKIARNVGEVDAKCSAIVLLAGSLNIACVGVSPQRKGAKVNSKDFKRITGWQRQSNQHVRDAAMVAWPYRRYPL
jgi:hypothetical protein